MKTVVIF